MPSKLRASTFAKQPGYPGCWQARDAAKSRLWDWRLWGRCFESERDAVPREKARDSLFLSLFRCGFEFANGVGQLLFQCGYVDFSTRVMQCVV